MVCIVCKKEHEKETVEHIVPRAMGNIHYILSKGKVCSNCNNRFSRFEHHVLNANPIYKMRCKMGLCPKGSLPTTVMSTEKLSRFLTKVAFESIYKSKPFLISRFDLIPLRKVLLGEPIKYKCMIDKRVVDGRPIPGFMDRWRLRRNGIVLSYQEKEEQLWFELRYVDLSYVIRLC